jgi:predicted porin
MKKSLLALAAMGAFVGAAQAQSSVTVYGLIDAGIGSGATTFGAGGASKASQNWIGGLSSANGTGMEAGSRLGFRGVEDIGGGNTIGFVYEIGINLSNAQSSTASPTTADVTTSMPNAAFFGNARQAYASIGNKGFGELRIGTQDSLAKNLLGGFDPGAEALVTGATSLYQQGVVVRYSQAATYQAPTIAGLVVRAQYANDGTTYGNAGATNTATTNNASSVSARWSQGPAAVGMVYEVRNQFTPTAVAVNVSNAMLPSLATTANVPSIAQFGAGASYNLGMVTPSVMYYNQKWNNPANAAAAGAITGTQLGAIVPVGKAVNIRASYTIGNVQNNGSNLYNTNAAQAMVDYSLSKRSRLYGIYGQTNWNSQRESYTASVKVQQYGLGLLHTF